MATAAKQITQARLAQYRAEVEDAAALAGDFVRSVVEAYQIAYPECSVADIRNYTISAINDAMQVFGAQTCQIANEFFEELAAQAGESVETEIFNTFDEGIMDKKVRVFAQDIVNGNVALFNGKVGDITQFFVKREAFENMQRNCNKNNVRYARVPSGRETCAFCFMLASRGFVYWTAQKAGAGFAHSYHRHCDCIIVPGFHTSVMDADAQIEGYNPTQLYERYRKCMDAVQTPQGTWPRDAFERDVAAGKYKKDEWEKWKTKRLCAEIETRDWGWVWKGEEPEPEYIKPYDNLNSSEKAALHLMKSNGYKVTTLSEDPKNKNVDFRINDEQLWEVKNIGEGKHSTEDRLRDAKHKWRDLNDESPVRVIITLEGNNKDKSTIVSDIEKYVPKYADEVIVMLDEETFTRIK